MMMTSNDQDAAFRYLLEGVRDGRLTVDRAMPLIAAVLQPGCRSNQPVRSNQVGQPMTETLTAPPVVHPWGYIPLPQNGHVAPIAS